MWQVEKHSGVPLWIASLKLYRFFSEEWHSSGESGRCEEWNRGDCQPPRVFRVEVVRNPSLNEVKSDKSRVELI